MLVLKIKSSKKKLILYQKIASRPIVCSPMATEFNEMIAIDLKVWGKHYILVIIDLATRFCAACVISNKLPTTIIKGLFISWIAISYLGLLFNER